MSIPSDSSRNIYCPPQSYGTRMILVPSVRRPSNVYPINCPQPGLNFPISTPVPYRIIRYSTPTPYQQIMTAYGVAPNLHGNENNINVKSTKNSLPTDDSKSIESKSTEEIRNDDPIDLSSTNLSTFSSSSKTSISPRENDSICETQKSPETIILKSPKKEPVTPPYSQPEPEQVQDLEQELEHQSDPESLGYNILINKLLSRHSRSRAQRKRKPHFFADNSLLRERSLEGWVGHVKPVPGIPRQAGSKREEVLKAARSLFSKRTRTLYHWLYPSTSKNKLKATVAAAWDTLSTAEKDFYISQVLGRFGVPAGSLMVNPQLGGFKCMSMTGCPTIGAPGAGSSSALVDETGRAVTNLLLSEDDVSWSSYPHAQVQEPPSTRKRRKMRNNNGESSSSRQHQEEEETRILKQIREESLEDDFADDPELSKEFEQFREITQNLDLSDFDFDMNLDGLLDGI